MNGINTNAVIFYRNRSYAVTVLLHGLPAGQKIRNIKDNPNVCFNAYEMRGLLIDCEGKPCDTNTDYVSVVIYGTARLLGDTSEKENVLRKIIQKYTPHLTETEIPMNMLKGTAVIQITIREMTGKYYH